MKKYFGKISYLGAPYLGFERQKEGKTIQGILEEQLTYLTGRKTVIKAAGRTDAGVNALGQTFTFEAKEICDLTHFMYALNRLLPRTMEVLELKEVPLSFDARHSCYGKIYRYDFSFGPKFPLQADVVAYLGDRRNFDLEKFQEALEAFEGKHCFKNFTSKAEDKDGFIRDVHIQDIQVDMEKRTGSVVFKSNGFMTYMVRFLMGAAFQCALGKIQVRDIKERLEREQRKIMSFKAPAEGLCLLEVLYPCN